MAIRGKSILQIREGLRSFCNRSSLFGYTTYVILENGQGFSLRNLLAKKRARRQLYKNFWHNHPALVRLSLPDAAIFIKNNTRLIYRDCKSGRSLTAKIAIKSDRRSGSLAREIRARKLLAHSSVPIPALLRYDSPRMRWLEEAYIEADEGISNAEKSEAFLRHHAQFLYAPMVRSRPLKSSLSRFRISWSELRDVFCEAGTKMPEGIEEGTWPVSVLHGELSTSNMVVGRDGRLFLVDWEKFRTGPVAWDLKNLFLSNKCLVYEVLQALSKPTDLAPKSQMRVAVAAEIVRRRRDRESKLAMHVSRNKKRDLTEQLLRAQDEILLAAIGGRPVAASDRSVKILTRAEALNLQSR